MDATIAVEQRGDDPFALTLVQPDGTATTMYLDNVFRETRELAPPDAEAHLERFLRTMVRPPTLPASWDDAAERLRPAVRCASTYGALVEGLVVRSIAPCLLEVLVVDHPDSMATASRDQATAWGIADDELFSRARAHLLADTRVDDFERYDPSFDGLLTFGFDDSYAASRLLILARVGGLRERIGGGALIAAAPDRGLLLVCSASNLAAVERLLETSKREYAAAARAISPVPYEVSAGGVRPATLARGTPLGRRLAEVALGWSVSEHEAQRAHLEESTAHDGVDVYVAKYGGREANGEFFSWSTWSRGVPTWLPETDRVGFYDPSNPAPFFARWSDVRELASDVMRAVPGVQPLRYEVLDWPSEAVVAELRARADGR